jgi:hypothetical protein
MFRTTLLLAILIPAASLAQTPNAATPSATQQVVQGEAQSSKDASAQAPQKQQLPFADMMTAWEYAPVEWK